MSQQGIQFVSSEAETYGKQQPACSWPRLSNDLFKEAIHTFSPRRGLPREATGPSTETCLWSFCLSRSPECSQDTVRTTKPRSCSLCSPAMLSRSSQFAELSSPLPFHRRSNNYTGFTQEKQKVICKAISNKQKSEDSNKAAGGGCFSNNSPAPEGTWDLV